VRTASDASCVCVGARHIMLLQVTCVRLCVYVCVCMCVCMCASQTLLLPTSGRAAGATACN
jgi:hypothetical protein